MQCLAMKLIAFAVNGLQFDAQLTLVNHCRHLQWVYPRALALPMTCDMTQSSSDEINARFVVTNVRGESLNPELVHTDLVMPALVVLRPGEWLTVLHHVDFALDRRHSLPSQIRIRFQTDGKLGGGDFTAPSEKRARWSLQSNSVTVRVPTSKASTPVVERDRRQ